MRIKRIALVAFVAIGIPALASHLRAGANNALVEYPAGYRDWSHVKTALVGPQSPIFQTYGGIHHIYANEKAMEGYRTGRFQDGSVIVFDLLETRDGAGITSEGPRRFIDVMAKDSKRFALTNGWGYEEFKGDSQTERVLTEQAKAACHKCHEQQKGRDYVFSAFRK